MASATGLRRVLIGESLKAEDGTASSDNGRKAHSGSKPRQAINRHCVVASVTGITLALFVIRIGVSLLIVGPAVSGTNLNTELQMSVNNSTQVFSQRKSSSALDSYTDASMRARRRIARILAKKSQSTLESSRRCSADKGIEAALGVRRDAYHSPNTFYQNFMEMACKFKIFVYPHSDQDPYKNILQPYDKPPTGNYASEHYFKLALLKSSLVTKDPMEADLFYMPFSVASMRNDRRIGVEGIKTFVKDYVANISEKYPFWNRSAGADHFYVNCHSIGKTATNEALHVRNNAIQVVCSSSYHIAVYFPHKDATIPQVWPRTDSPKRAGSITQRTTLAFFAGAGNSPVRAEVAKYWVNDSEIKVYTQRISTPYDEALLTSKYCLHVKGFEVNTARLADAMHYGCVPVIIANYHDLPYNDVLDWSRFSLVVTTEDIPRLKEIIKAVSDEEYVKLQKNVMQVRQHFEWHEQPQPFDAFYMVMHELWLRRHVVRFTLS